MLSNANYTKILNYFDRQFWGGKTDETNWHYYGIILDWYFDNSVFCIDYLDIADYLDSNGGFSFSETEPFSQQYAAIEGLKRLELIQAILNLIKASTVNTEQSEHIITVITNVLARDTVKVIAPDSGPISIKPDDILDSGSYCNVVRVKEGILRKELKTAYKDDPKLQKRMQYEFENMTKLSGCPQILNVFDYDETTHSYLMEQAEMNLAVYLQGEIDPPFEERLKIVMDILLGMNYAHSHSIIHRDLHLGNVLKIGNDYVICDFGLSKDLSIVRSMKSSYTQKNNHLFVDPLALTDFTLLDKKSDIYSIGKMMDYIFTYNAPTTNHIFKTIVERCICRDKTFRYDSIDQIIADIKTTLKSQAEENKKRG
jgi:serine/threonine protein kinase